MIKVYFSLPEYIDNHITDIAKVENKTRTEIMRLALARGLKILKTKKASSSPLS